MDRVVEGCGRAVLVRVARGVDGGVVVRRADGRGAGGPECLRREAVPEQEVVRGGKRLETARLTGGVHADGVPEERDDDGLVDRHPHRHPVTETLADEGRVLTEAKGRLPGHPPSLRLELRGEVPVVQRDEGSDPRLAERVHGPVVEVEPGGVGRSGAGGLDAWPGDGEAVGVDPEVGEQRDVLVPPVEAVARDGAGGTVEDRARPVAEVVPDAAATTARAHAPFDLVAGGGCPDDEVAGQGHGSS